MTFREYAEGKSVCVVAPGRYLQGSKQREQIESHDLVARLNLGWPVPPAIVPDIGERTDILFHLLNVGIARSETEFRACMSKVGFIVGVHAAGEARTRQFIKMNNGRIPFEAVPLSLRQYVKVHIKRSPNCGVMAIAYLLSQPLKSLYLTGYSFYEDGYYVGYGGRDERRAAAMKGGVRGHDQRSQKLFVQKLLQTAKFPVTMDAVMQRILDGEKTVKLQLLEVKAMEIQQPVVKLVATMILHRGNGLIMPGDSFLAPRKHAVYLIEKERAVLQ